MQMKYVVEYRVHTAGLTYDQNLANMQALVNAFSKWEPEEGLTFHAFVTKLNGASGYALVETADPSVVMSFVSKFSFWNEIEVIPVVDIGEAIRLGTESRVWARAASSG